jgi:ribonuclease HII
VTLPTPHLRAEWALWQSGRRLVVGVDEVGMGALCAPVVAAAVLVKPNCKKIPGVRDSKTLSARQREAVVGQIRRRALAVGVGAASVGEIERLNIYHAAHLAMRRALRRIGSYDHVLVDGRKIVGFEDHIGPYTAIVDGDESSYAIACASIVAKVTRDRLMAKLAVRYPAYGWEHNAGYTTRDHVAALAEHGPSVFHRRTYARIRALLEGEQLPLELLADESVEGSSDLLAVADAAAVDAATMDPTEEAVDAQRPDAASPVRPDHRTRGPGALLRRYGSASAPA